MSEFENLNAQAAVVGKTRLDAGIADVTIAGNTVPNNLPPDRVVQTRVDTLLANTGEERDRINALDPPGDLDPVYQLGKTGYRLFGNLSRRNGVNHKTLTWYAWRMSKDDLA